MPSHNINSGDSCKFCDVKLKDTHHVIADWFRRCKKQFNNVHISCSYRNAAAQEQAVLDGRSIVQFPKSKHNFQIKGEPCSLALDLFVIDEDGIAKFPWKFYEGINRWNETNKEPIRWGGTFSKLVDGPHFELMGHAKVGDNGPKEV